MIEPIDLATGWWERLAAGCLRNGRIRPARAHGRRVHLWPATQIAHAGVMVGNVLGTGERPDHDRQVDAVFRALDWYRSREAWGPRRGGRPRYADDVAWLGLARAALADVRGASLDADAHRALAFVRSCEHPEGGVRWHEDASSRHTCSTAPGAHLALRAHAETGDPDALAFARRSMRWLDDTLSRPDGRYGDHVDGAVDDTVWAYNQGEAATAWWMLDGRPPDDAIITWLADPDVLWSQPQVFVGIGLRNVIPLDTSGRLLDAARVHLERVAAEGMADDGFPRAGGPGRYGDDVSIDMAGLIQIAAACAGEPRSSR